MKPKPVMRTSRPHAPLVGLKLRIVGAWLLSTVKNGDCADPPGVEREIGPATVPAGICTVSWESLTIEKLALTPPAPVDPEIQKIVLKGYDRGETPITARPGDVLEPEMDAAFKATEGIAKDVGDVLTYALYPTTGMRFLKWKYGLEEPPPETKAKTMEDIKREDEIIAKAKAGLLAEKQPAAEPVKAADSVEEKVATAPPTEKESDGTAVLAPMPGLIIRFEVKVGDKVKAGDNIAVLEAMKMAIDLPSPVDGTVKTIKFKDGDNVARDDVLVIIG